MQNNLYAVLSCKSPKPNKMKRTLKHTSVLPKTLFSEDSDNDLFPSDGSWNESYVEYAQKNQTLVLPKIWCPTPSRDV
jgi:hypothetical protein